MEAAGWGRENGAGRARATASVGVATCSRPTSRLEGHGYQRHGPALLRRAGTKDGSWQDNLFENVAFCDASGKLNAQGREAFIQSFSGFLRAVDKVLLKQLIVEGPNAAAVVSYDYVNPSGGHLHQDDAEVWKVENGQIVSLTIYFDITEFRGFMGR